MQPLAALVAPGKEDHLQQFITDSPWRTEPLVSLPQFCGSSGILLQPSGGVLDRGMGDLHAVLERLLPVELHLRLVTAHLGTMALDLTLQSERTCAPCPRCQSLSSSVHSRYTRHVQDLPWSTLPVTLHLIVRRFRCRVARCSQRVFAERFPALAEPFSRCTSALRAVLWRIALSVGGEPGKRVLQGCHIATSGDRLLTVLRDGQPQPVERCIAVGIDDFALRKGIRYGTVVVDLETRKPIDFLPDRTVQTVSSWLAGHPEIEVVSRDRPTEYERGVTLSAPQAKGGHGPLACREELARSVGTATAAVPNELRRSEARIDA